VSFIKKRICQYVNTTDRIIIEHCHTAIENPSDPIGYLFDFTNPYLTPDMTLL
jgi:hypothetical protein